MELERIKSEIVHFHGEWNALDGTLDSDKYAEMYEDSVRSLIIKYCENNGYEVEGYPFQKKILCETDDNYDEDYFCYERNLKYLDVLATTQDDVLELMHFFCKTFWPDQTESKEDYKNELLSHLKIDGFYIEF